MATLGRRPGRGRGFVTYTWDSVPPESKRHGYLAGNVHGLICHVGKKTKPCRKQLIGPHADCPHCLVNPTTDWVGYVPLRDHTGKPTCVLIRSAVADMVDRIKPGSRVQWGRDKGQYDPIWIILSTTGHPWEHWWPDRKPDDDLIPWLCTFWREPELQSALYSYLKPECLPAVTAHQPAPPSAPEEPAGTWVRGVQDAGAKSIGYSDFPSLARAVKDGRKEQPNNGKKGH